MSHYVDGDRELDDIIREMAYGVKNLAQSTRNESSMAAPIAQAQSQRQSSGAAAAAATTTMSSEPGPNNKKPDPRQCITCGARQEGPKKKNRMRTGQCAACYRVSRESAAASSTSAVKRKCNNGMDGALADLASWDAINSTDESDSICDEVDGGMEEKRGNASAIITSNNTMTIRIPKKDISNRGEASYQRQKRTSNVNQRREKYEQNRRAMMMSGRNTK